MFHREGFRIISVSLFITIALCVGASFFENIYLQKVVQIVALLMLVLILQFFRNPKRKVLRNDEHILSSVDGKVVIIEKVFEKEYFHNERIQLSVFMSPLNVHVTRYPIGGKILFSKYHPGKYLVAWNPKSSELNERTTVVLENPVTGPILFRQIAGALARRIVNYAVEGKTVGQGTESGFIKFGSRVDIFLPLDAKILTKVGEKVKGGKTILAKA